MSLIKREQGFTLFETIAVLTVLVLIYSLALQMTGRSYHRLLDKTDLQQMVSDLELLQAESMMEPGYTLQAIFYPADSGGGSHYWLDFGYKVVTRNLKGLKLAGEEEKKVILYEPESVREDREYADGIQRFATEEESPFDAGEIQEISFEGMTKNYLLLVRENGEFEVTTR